MKRNVRFLVQATRDFCAENGLKLHEKSQAWLLKIEAPHRPHYIFGYDMGLNRSVAQQLAADKSAAFDVLAMAGIPAVEHVLFHSPSMREYVGSAGNWSALSAYLEAHGDVVCKAHAGTGGRNVFRARTINDLEDCVQTLFRSHRAITLSPFLNYAHEYRVVVLEGEVALVYRKDRPSVTGDGHSTIAQLLPADFAPVFGEEMAGCRLDLSQVPAAGEQVAIEWRHNLAHGSNAVVLSAAEAKPLADLAARAAAAIGLSFCSVDIADAGDLQVMEVNAGVMMEAFAAASPGNEAMARKIYHAALRKALAS